MSNNLKYKSEVLRPDYRARRQCSSICTKNVQVTVNMLFYGFDGVYGVWVVCEPLFSTVVYTLVQTNAARSAFCAACSIPRFIQICTGPVVCDEYILTG